VFFEVSIMEQWNSKFSVGLDVIDDQHKEFFKLVDELSEAVEQRQEIDKNYTMARLEVYSLYHFTSEEHLMKKYNYPELEDHLKEHKKFRVKILKFKDEFIDCTGKDNKVADEIVEYLENWITNHILDTDKMYSPYLEG
jgi:hemerythrin